MSDTLINVERLEAILQKHWAEFIEPTQMMRLVLEHTRDTKFLKVEQEQIPKKHTQIVVTKFARIDKDMFEVWVEYTVPKGDSVIVGTVLLTLTLGGYMEINESFGTEFVPKRT